MTKKIIILAIATMLAMPLFAQQKKEAVKKAKPNTEKKAGDMPSGWQLVPLVPALRPVYHR